MKHMLLFLLMASFCVTLVPEHSIHADDPAAGAAKPLRVLIVTGGCCHDYTRQKKILSEGIAARANVEFVIAHQGGTGTKSMIPLYEDPDWAKGFDAVIHNECFADVKDLDYIERILKPHREGVPSIVIHCAMHCYRGKTDEWFKYLGVTSRRHGGNFSYEIQNVKPDHPAMKGFGEKWKTPKGELYQIEKVWDTATVLGKALNQETKKEDATIWTNTYGKGRVFGTTVGHFNEEMLDPVFLNYVTNGLLWATGKTDDAGINKPAATVKMEDHPSSAKEAKPAVDPAKQPTPAKPKTPKTTNIKPGTMVPVNLALGKPCKASSEQTENDHYAIDAVDNDDETRWCPANGQEGHWWQVDLEKPEELTGIRIMWEMANREYGYKVEGSTDEKSWKILVDETKPSLKTQIHNHKFSAKDVRFLRITVTDLQPGVWGSFWEFEAQGTKLVDAAEQAVIVPQQKTPASTIVPKGEELLKGVKVAPGFKAMLFAEPPQISYPTCICAAPTGEVFVGVDLNGSLDVKAGRGKIFRCADRDGDGRADEFKEFAKLDSPRGLIWDAGTLYVLHPPYLRALHDDNADGVADRQEVLVDGIGRDLKFRGADHTTNGIQMGIDGWIYVAVGDYGFVKATGTDGKSQQLFGGGVVRVRPDGTELEIVSRGQRNIYDVAIDPQMNLFTRDNTNDGGGWNVRLSHVIPGAEYGYPRLFINFPDEIAQPLVDYGGGSPCGALFLDEPGFPAGYGSALYMVEWGRSAVIRHPLTKNGASFKAEQPSNFIELSRPTDMEVDGQGNLYITSWKDGGFNFSKPDVGFIVRVQAEGNKQPAFPDLKKATEQQLLEHLQSASHTLRLATQREMLRRGKEKFSIADLKSIAASDKPLAVRVAAIFTMKQLFGAEAHPELVLLFGKEDLREFAIKAIGDRTTQPDKSPAALADLLTIALTDELPRVRLQAAFALAHLGFKDKAAKIVPLVADADPMIAHIAVESLISLNNGAACLEALDKSKPEEIPGLIRVLQSVHEPAVVDGLLARLEKATSPALRQGIMRALCRLYHREDEWKGSWWGTRPDTRGPFYFPVTWSESEKIGKVLSTSLDNADAETAAYLLVQLDRHRIVLPGGDAKLLKLAESNPAFLVSAVEVLAGRKQLNGESIVLLERVALNDSAATPLRLKAFSGLSKATGKDTGGKNSSGKDSLAAAVRVVVAWQRASNSPAEMQRAGEDFLRDGGHTQNAAFFAALAEGKDSATRDLALAVLLYLDSNKQTSKSAKATAATAIEKAWKQPANAASVLRAIGQTRIASYGDIVKKHLADESPEVKAAALFAANELRLIPAAGSEKDLVANLPYEQVVARAMKLKGDVVLGGQLFVKQNCVACHTVATSEVPKGPFLGGIAARYSRAELLESMLKPSVKIAQGFETQYFVTEDGMQLEGFVTRESGDEVELRNQQGQVTILPKSKIESRGKREISIMPNGLADKLTVPEVAALMAYLESLKGK